ncbi:MAG: DUF3029 family protein [Clostridia bacterium]|nr:DUF3029 family protein [Clostridia bacterium]
MRYEFKTKREPFARGFLNCESEYKGKRMAAGLLLASRECPFEFNKDGLPYAYRNCIVNYHFGMGIYIPEEAYVESIFEANRYSEQDIEETKRICRIMQPHMQLSYVDTNLFSEKMMRMYNEEGCEAGGWLGHCVPALYDVCRYGTVYYREKIAKYREINKDKDCDEFYDSMEIVLDAIDVCGKRFYDLAVEELAQNPDEERTYQLEIARDTFDHAPVEPCRDFAEACLVYAMMYSFDGLDSPGHFDQYMYDFWKVTEPEKRERYLRYIWTNLADCRAWNLCLSGSDENGNDLTNDLTYAILDVMKEIKRDAPNVTLRWHKNTPEKLMKAAYETIATGCGMPGLYNDNAVIPALERLGIPKADAHTYVMNGCNQIDIPGKSHMGLEDGDVNVAKAVEYTLHNGVSPKKGIVVGLETGDPTEFKTFDEFYAAFIKQLDNILLTVTQMANMQQHYQSYYANNPVRSLFIEGCIEKGREYKNKGPLYGHGQILLVGLADTADSLAAVKKYVYEEKRFTMAQLIDALNKNFEGYDEMYSLLKNSELKFGNDNDYVDSIAVDLTDHANEYLLSLETFRGGYYSGGCSPFKAAAAYGGRLSALPNGKKNGESLYADSIGATPGFDTNGPTALINSCLKYDHTLPGSGFILNLKFDKSIFTSQAGEESFLALWRTYFEGGGQMLTATVVSPEELQDAMIHPENHKNLIVRVGGFSARFVTLSRGLQQNVLARTVH